MLYANGDSTVTTTDCTMTSNSALWIGGAISAEKRSIVGVTNCTMASNSASKGGVLHATDTSTVITTDCTMTSNSAYQGGAIHAAGDSTVTASDCLMTFNSAWRGGAVAVGGNSSSHIARTALARCVLTSNTADRGGTGASALSVLKGGFVDLLGSVFQSNVGNDHVDDGVGIVNSNGQVQCDVSIGCLPVCTVCRDEEVPTLPPTQPTAQITTMPTYRHSAAAGRTQWTDGWPVILFVFCLSALSVLVVVDVVRRCCRLRFAFKLGRTTDQPGGEDYEEIGITSIELPRVDAGVDMDDAAVEHGSANEEAALTNSPIRNEAPFHTGNRVPFLPRSAIGSSPAPIFAIDSEMRVVSWSQGTAVRTVVASRYSHITLALSFVAWCCVHCLLPQACLSLSR